MPFCYFFKCQFKCTLYNIHYFLDIFNRCLSILIMKQNDRIMGKTRQFLFSYFFNSIIAKSANQYLDHYFDKEKKIDRKIINFNVEQMLRSKTYRLKQRDVRNNIHNIAISVTLKHH